MIKNKFDNMYLANPELYDNSPLLKKINSLDGKITRDMNELFRSYIGLLETDQIKQLRASFDALFYKPIKSLIEEEIERLNSNQSNQGEQ